MHEVALASTDVGVVELLVNLQRLRLDPLSVLVIESLLCDLADVDLRIEVGSESLVVVSGVAVDDVEILDLVEVVLGGVGRVSLRHTRVEAATEDGGKASLLEALLICPLPAVFEVGLVLRLIVGRVEVVASASQASIHDGQVLVGQGQVDDQLRLVAIEERLQLLHVVGIHLGRLDVQVVALVVDGFGQTVTFLHVVAGNHQLGEHLLVLCNLKCANGGHATSANH